MLGLMASSRHPGADAGAAVVSAVEGRHLAAAVVVVASVEGGGPADVASVVVIKITSTAVTSATLIWRKKQTSC